MKTLLYLGVFTTLMFSCKKDSDPVLDPDDNLIEIAKSNSVDGLYQIKILSGEALYVGYNTLKVELKKVGSGEVISNASVSLVPMMDMGTMMHSCPIESNLVETSENNKYTFRPTFVMPSTDMASWALNFTAVIGNESTLFKVPIEVKEPEEPKLVMFEDIDNSKKYFIALTEPASPSIGVNDIKVAVYTKKSMMEWPAVDGLSFTIEPWMPSMDHGSPNNVAPVSMGAGLYQGEVNFTMSGEWEIKLEAFENENKIGEAMYTISF